MGGTDGTNFQTNGFFCQLNEDKMEFLMIPDFEPTPSPDAYHKAREALYIITTGFEAELAVDVMHGRRELCIIYLKCKSITEEQLRAGHDTFIRQFVNYEVGQKFDIALSGDGDTLTVVGNLLAIQMVKRLVEHCFIGDKDFDFIAKETLVFYD